MQSELFSPDDTFASPIPLRGKAAIQAAQRELDEAFSELNRDFANSRAITSLVDRLHAQKRLGERQAELNARRDQLEAALSKKGRPAPDPTLIPLNRRRVTMSERMALSIQKLSLRQKRVVSLAAALLYGTTEPAPIVTITARDYAAIFGISIRQAYMELKDGCGWDTETKQFLPDRGLLDAHIQLRDGPSAEDEASIVDPALLQIPHADGAKKPPAKTGKRKTSKNGNSSGIQYTFIRWVQQAKYLEGEGTVEIQFAQELVPHLRNVAGRFGSYLLENTKGLRDVSAWRLADVLAHQSLGKFTMPLDELCVLLEATSERHKEFKHFNAEVLKPAIKALNARFSLAGADPADRSLNLHLKVKKVLNSSHAVQSLEFTFNHHRLNTPHG